MRVTLKRRSFFRFGAYVPDVSQRITTRGGQKGGIVGVELDSLDLLMMRFPTANYFLILYVPEYDIGVIGKRQHLSVEGPIHVDAVQPRRSELECGSRFPCFRIDDDHLSGSVACPGYDACQQ